MTRILRCLALGLILISATAFAASDPVTSCFREAKSLSGANLSQNLSLRLCRGATSSSGPVECFRAATSFTGGALDAENAVKLCSRDGTPERGLCYRNAAAPVTGLGLSQAEALYLCSIPPVTCAATAPAHSLGIASK